jgi:hypothetical protein
MNRSWARWAEVIKAQADVAETEEPIADYVGPHGPVRAVRLTISNVRAVSQWILARGGAVAGMRIVVTGGLETRGMELGDWLGGTQRFNVGDWVVEVVEGDFHRVGHDEWLAHFHLG